MWILSAGWLMAVMTDGSSAVADSHQISDRVTRKESAELSIARMKVSSLE